MLRLVDLVDADAITMLALGCSASRRGKVDGVIKKSLLARDTRAGRCSYDRARVLAAPFALTSALANLVYVLLHRQSVLPYMRPISATLYPHACNSCLPTYYIVYCLINIYAVPFAQFGSNGGTVADEWH